MRGEPWELEGSQCKTVDTGSQLFVLKRGRMAIDVEKSDHRYFSNIISSKNNAKTQVGIKLTDLRTTFFSKMEFIKKELFKVGFSFCFDASVLHCMADVFF